MSLCFFLAWSVLVKKNSPTFSGTVEVEEYYLGTPVAGRIKEIYVSEGDKVEKGQRVAVMEHFDQA